MKRTFLVDLEIPDDGSALPADVAEDIHSDLLSSGYDVISVKPWKSPNEIATSLGLTNPAPLAPNNSQT